MASLKTCTFCTKQTINHDHDDCAEKFMRNLERQLVRWAKTHPNNPGLPKRIREKFFSPQYHAYTAYLIRQREREQLDRKIIRISQMLQHRIDKVVMKVIKKYQKCDHGLEIIADTKLTCRPRQTF